MPRGFKIRPAKLGDLGVLVHQRHCVFESMGYDRAKLRELDHDYRRWARRRLLSGTLIGWIVEDRLGVVVGGAVLWLRKGARAPPTSRIQLYLTSMYTEPTYRGNGVASLLVQEAIKWARSHGYASILIHTSKMARSFYPRFGFKRTWEMECNLTGHMKGLFPAK